MCCLFGIIDYGNSLSIKKKERIIKVLSKECEERGTDATGIAYIHNGNMCVHKSPLPAHKMKFKFTSNPSVIMGHTRMTTQGSEKNNINNHPFYSKKIGFALAHNGVLYNDKILRKSEKLPSTKIETDSYIAVQLIEKTNVLDFDSIKCMSEKVEGSFCFTLLSKENELYIVKGSNPMAIAQFNGFYVYASTTNILMRALKKLRLMKFKNVKIEDGDIFKFDLQGYIHKSHFDFEDDYIPYYNYLYSPTRTHNSQDVWDEYEQDLLYYAKSIGVDEDVIIELLEDGYDYTDIEDMLYEFDINTNAPTALHT